jgi:phage shock protein A
MILFRKLRVQILRKKISRAMNRRSAFEKEYESLLAQRAQLVSEGRKITALGNKATPKQLRRLKKILELFKPKAKFGLNGYMNYTLAKKNLQNSEKLENLRERKAKISTK